MRIHRPLVWTLGALVLTPALAAAAPVLRGADARVAFQAPTACTVELTLTVDGAREVEHRVEVVEGARVELLEVRGAARVGELKDVGRTRALVVRPEADSYSLRYSVEQPATRADRCPLWIPTAAADGRTRSVRLTVRIPAGATPVGTMPTLVWTGEEGTATIGNLPAFVRVPFSSPGAPAPLNIARVMDAVSIATLVLATLAWARRNTRKPQAPGLKPQTRDTR